MSTKKNVETDANEKKKYPHVAKRYLKRHYKKVLEIQQKYRDENREKVREWHKTAQQKFYEKEISGLIVLAKKSMAILKETKRIDMDDDIEDAEFIIENYEKNSL